LARGDLMADLAASVGLGGDVLEANPAAKKRFIVRHGALQPLPAGPGAFLSTRLFSPKAKLRLMLEPFIGRGDHEESIADFVARRLGAEFRDWAIDPFVSGVYAGDPYKLSVRAATGKIYALEAGYRSLFIGALARLIQRKTSGPMPAGKLVGLRSGMQSLPLALSQALGDAVRAGEPAEALSRGEDGVWTARTSGGEYSAEQLVLALPAHECAGLLRPLDATLADELDAIDYPPVATVALGFRREQVRHPLDGFGALIPRLLNIPTLGALFSSTLFPGRAPEGHVLITAFLGGARNRSVADMEESAIIAQVVKDLSELLGIQGEPVFSRTLLWREAIPQYEIGHLERIARVDERLGALPGLHVRANWRDGISVSDCLTNAHDLAQSLAA
jgi:oxygen-dependent protoporphyrinogen oxidase